MIYFLCEVNCRFLSILLHKYLISIFFTSFIEEIIIWFSFLCLHAAKKVSFKISCSLSLLCWLQNLQVEWLFTSGGSLQANLKIFIFHRQITHQLHFFPTFTQLTSYIPHILLEITSFLLPIWSTFVYEASVLSLSLPCLFLIWRVCQKLCRDGRSDQWDSPGQISFTGLQEKKVSF